MYKIVTSISIESLLMMCVNSCHATASISFLFRLFKSHLVKQIRESLALRHNAKAFIHSSSMIPIFGVGSQRVIQRFSTILYISGSSLLVTSLAQEKENIIFFS
jgi:hypothetical protein